MKYSYTIQVQIKIPRTPSDSFKNNLLCFAFKYKTLCEIQYRPNPYFTLGIRFRD